MLQTMGETVGMDRSGDVQELLSSRVQMCLGQLGCGRGGRVVKIDSGFWLGKLEGYFSEFGNLGERASFEMEGRIVDLVWDMLSEMPVKCSSVDTEQELGHMALEVQISHSLTQSE